MVPFLQHYPVLLPEAHWYLAQPSALWKTLIQGRPLVIPTCYCTAPKDG